MTVPAIVQERLGDETVTTRVPLGDDELFVTPVRALIYRAEGLLSGESVESYPLEAERVAVNEGRRKCTITLDHGLDGESQFSVPADRYEQAIEPILGGVFAAAGITDPEESIEEVYRLGELSVVITDARVIKHVGNSLWDEEFEEYPFDAVTGIDVEEGSVSSQIIVEVDRRPQRIKTPTDDARRIRRKIQDGVLAYQGFATYEEFRQKVELEAELDAEPVEATPQAEAAEATATEEEAAASEPRATVEPDGEEPSPEPEPADAELSSGMVFGEAGDDLGDEAESAATDAVAEELAQLTQAVQRQNDLIRRNQQAIEQLTRQLDRDE